MCRPSLYCLNFVSKQQLFRFSLTILCCLHFHNSDGWSEEKGKEIKLSTQLIKRTDSEDTGKHMQICDPLN